MAPQPNFKGQIRRYQDASHLELGNKGCVQLSCPQVLSRVFTGIDIIVLLVVIGFVLYLAGPESSPALFQWDPLAALVVIAVIILVVSSL